MGQGLIYLHRDVTGETVVPLIHCDSNDTLSTIRSMITSKKAKRIDVPFHNSRHFDTAGVVKFNGVNTLENLADVMTRHYRRRSINILLKALVCTHFNKRPYCAHGIGLRLRYSCAHGISLRSHAHGIGSSCSHLHKRFLICAVPIYTPRQKF